MSTQDLRRLFDSVLVDAAPDTTDIESALVGGRRRRRRRQAGILLSVAAVAVVVTGLVVASARTQPDPVLGPSPSPSTSVTAPVGALVTKAEQMYGPWQLASLAGVPIDPQGKPVLVHFGTNLNTGPGSSWGADDGCNYHNGTYAISSDGTITSTVGAQTLVGCSVVPFAAVPDSIAKAHQARIAPASGSRPRTLVLVGADGSVLATYTPYPWATNPSVPHERPSSTLPSATYLASYISMTEFDAVARAKDDGWGPRVDPYRGSRVDLLTPDLHQITFQLDARGRVTKATAG